MTILTSVYVAAKGLRTMDGYVRAQRDANRINLLHAELEAVKLEDIVRSTTNPATRARARAALQKLDQLTDEMDAGGR